MAAMVGESNTSVSYNSQDISQYCNQAQLDMVVAELEATNFASTGSDSDPGLTTYSINLQGDWTKALDTILAPDALTPTKRTTVIGFGPSGAGRATYTWTNKAFISNYTINANNPKEKITWSAKLNLSGNPVRA